MSLSPAQQTFVSTLSQQSGLNPNVVAAWVTAESGGATSTRGTNNFLNFGHPNEPSFPTPQAGAISTYMWMVGNSNYKGILSSASSTPANQLQAIINSPWDSSHYNNGANLLKDYSSVGGSLAQVLQTPLNIPSAAAYTATYNDPCGPRPVGATLSIFPWIVCKLQSDLVRGAEIVIGFILIIVALVIFAKIAGDKTGLTQVAETAAVA